MEGELKRMLPFTHLRLAENESPDRCVNAISQMAKP